MTLTRLLHLARPWRMSDLRVVFVPSSLYMRHKYPELSGYPVAILHLRRILDGLRRRIP